MRISANILSGALMLALCAGVFVPAHEARAAVSFGAAGTGATGATSLSVPLPAGIVAGNLLVLSISSKYPTNAPTTPTGWQAVNNGEWIGGLGSAAADSGQVYSTIFVRVADGTESGNVSTSVASVTGSCMAGVVSRFEKTSDAWDVAATNGADNTAGPTHVDWSVTGAANIGLAAGDMVITTSAVNSDDFSYTTPMSLTATGATIGSHTEQNETGSSSGHGCEVVITTHAVSSGTASVAPTFAMTSSGTETAVAPTGATVFLRIREVANPSAETTITSPVSVTGGISVLGALAKGAGTFMIDHPLDPKNKLLYHSFVESPEVKNLYDGIATLDEKGEATIELPSYFLALNRSYRYLGTPVGEPMPRLHLAQEVKPKWFGWFGTPAFKISGGVPGGKVSWQVSGVRHDPYILANPIVPEVRKGPDEIADVGEYICPECYE